MNATECGQLLAQMATYDYRDVDPVIVASWLQVIGDLPYTDARAAVTAYYGEHRERMMPADVRGRVKAVRADRLKNSPLTGRPPADPEEYAAWLAAERKRIADGQPAPRAVAGP